MKRAKRILASLLSCTLLLCGVYIPTFAEGSTAGFALKLHRMTGSSDSGSLTVGAEIGENDTLKAGDYVRLTLGTNADVISEYQVVIDYESALLAYQSALEVWPFFGGYSARDSLTETWSVRTSEPYDSGLIISAGANEYNSYSAEHLNRDLMYFLFRVNEDVEDTAGTKLFRLTQSKQTKAKIGYLDNNHQMVSYQNPDISAEIVCDIDGVTPTLNTVKLYDSAGVETTGEVLADAETGVRLKAMAFSAKENNITNSVAWSVTPGDKGVSIAGDGTVTVDAKAKDIDYTITARADGTTILKPSASGDSVTVTLRVSHVPQKLNGIKIMNGDTEVLSEGSVTVDGYHDVALTVRGVDQYGDDEFEGWTIDALTAGGARIGVNSGGKSVTIDKKSPEAENVVIRIRDCESDDVREKGFRVLRADSEARDIVLYKGDHAVIARSGDVFMDTVNIPGSESVTVDYTCKVIDQFDAELDPSGSADWTIAPAGTALAGHGVSFENGKLTVTEDCDLPEITLTAAAKAEAGGSVTKTLKVAFNALTFKIADSGNEGERRDLMPSDFVTENEVYGSTWAQIVRIPDILAYYGDEQVTADAEHPFVFTVAGADGGDSPAAGRNVPYTVKFTGAGHTDVIVFADGKVDIAPKNIADITAFAVEADGLTYDGTEKEPIVSVTGLSEGKDYTVAYSNNTNAYTDAAFARENAPTVTLTGIGNYTGTITEGFLIAKARNPMVVTATRTMKISGKSPSTLELKGLVSAAAGAVSFALPDENQGFSLNPDTGVLTAPAAEKTVDVAVAAAGDENHAPATGKITVSAVDVTAVPVEIGTLPEYTYTGAGQSVPTGLVKVSGASGGTVTMVYTPDCGEGKTPGKLDVEGLPLDAGDYTVTAVYEDDVGLGHYGISTPTAFRIGRKDASNATVTPAATGYEYSGSPRAPAVTVALGGTTIPATDYTVAYEDNINVGRATIRVTFRGNYIGSVSESFEIFAKPQLITDITARKGGAVHTSLVGSDDETTVSVSGARGTVMFSSSDSAVAAVDSSGRVTPKSNGIVTISAYAEATEVYAKSNTLRIDLDVLTDSVSKITRVTGGSNDRLTAALSGHTILISGVLDGKTTELSISYLDQNGTAKTVNGIRIAAIVSGNQTVAETEESFGGVRYAIRIAAEGNAVSPLIPSGPIDVSTPPTAAPAPAPAAEKTEPIRFADVVAGSFYEKAVEWAVAGGITKGTTDTSFSPDAPCTRAQAVTFLYRAAGEPEVTVDAKFADVEAGSFYEKAVAWAVVSGITNGVSATEFEPNAACTRGQIVTFISRFEKAEAVESTKFTDVPSGEFYTGAVGWAVANGITNGVSDTEFEPNAPCTRGQIVTFLFRDFVK